MSIMDLLEEEYGLLAQMAEALKKENKALINDDTASLEKIVNAKEKLNDSFEKIEDQRICGYGNSSISSIIMQLEESGRIEEARELNMMGMDMKQKAEDIKQLNETNSLLIRQSLSYVKSIINILLPVRNKLYSQSGEINIDAQQKNMLDISI